MHLVGLSYSRCVLDIVEDRVSFDDVLVIITGTRFDPNIDDHWESIWDGYYRDGAVWSKSKCLEDQFREVSLNLYNDGKLHQPRQFGGFSPSPVIGHWRDTILVNRDLEKNLAAKRAWEKFQVIAGLSGIAYNKREL
jgi:hypothetical protein